MTRDKKVFGGVHDYNLNLSLYLNNRNIMSWFVYICNSSGRALVFIYTPSACRYLMVDGWVESLQRLDRADVWSRSLCSVSSSRTRSSLSWPNRYLSPSNSSVLGLHLVLKWHFSFKSGQCNTRDPVISSTRLILSKRPVRSSAGESGPLQTREMHPHVSNCL